MTGCGNCMDASNLHRKILVTGANGLLGQYLVRQLLDQQYQVIAMGRGSDRLPFAGRPGYRYLESDLRNDDDLHKLLINERPASIVHAAALTQVDYCEKHQEECFDINVSGTARLLNHAHGCEHFIYVSTDFVFDGEKGHYLEDDVTCPVNWYGVTKQKAEQLTRESKVPYTIVRTCLVYGRSLSGTRSNIISWTKEKLEKKEPISVVADQFRTPTHVEDLSKGILLVLQKKAQGIFHISGKDTLTPYDMAMQAAGYFGLDTTLISKVNADSFRQPARRPLKTGFVIDKARRLLGYEPMSFEDGLKCAPP